MNIYGNAKAHRKQLAWWKKFCVLARTLVDGYAEMCDRASSSTTSGFAYLPYTVVAIRLWEMYGTLNTYQRNARNSGTGAYNLQAASASNIPMIIYSDMNNHQKDTPGLWYGENAGKASDMDLRMRLHGVANADANLQNVTAAALIVGQMPIRHRLSATTWNTYAVFPPILNYLRNILWSIGIDYTIKFPAIVEWRTDLSPSYAVDNTINTLAFAPGYIGFTVSSGSGATTLNSSTYTPQLDPRLPLPLAEFAAASREVEFLEEIIKVYEIYLRSVGLLDSHLIGKTDLVESSVDVDRGFKLFMVRKLLEETQNINPSIFRHMPKELINHLKTYVTSDIISLIPAAGLLVCDGTLT